LLAYLFFFPVIYHANLKILLRCVESDPRKRWSVDKTHWCPRCWFALQTDVTSWRMMPLRNLS